LLSNGAKPKISAAPFETRSKLAPVDIALLSDNFAMV